MSGYRRLGAFGVRLSEQLEFVDGAGDYGYLTGSRNRTSVEVTRRLDRTTWALSYEYETNSRDDLALVDEFFSHSPSVHQLSTSFQYDFSGRLSGELRLHIRLSSYHHENVERDADDSLEQRNRQENRFGVTVRLAHRITDSWHLFGEYQHTDNDANFDRYAYSSNRYLFGVERTH